MRDVSIASVLWVAMMITSFFIHWHLCEMEKRMLLEICELKKINSSDTQRSQQPSSMQWRGVDL
jgi:hypothetical protein